MWLIPRVCLKKVEIEEYLLDELKYQLSIDDDTEAVREAVRRIIELEEALYLLDNVGLGPPVQEDPGDDPEAWGLGD